MRQKDSLEEGDTFALKVKAILCLMHKIGLSFKL